MLKELKRIFVLFCILFTFATLLNSALNLIFGFEFSLHLHIFERAALNFINAAILSVVFKLRHKELCKNKFTLSSIDNYLLGLIT